MATIQDDVVRLEKADGSRKLVTTDCVYDLTEDKTQEAVNSEIRNTLTQLDSAKAAKIDLTNINQTSPNCTVTNGIAKGTYFYLDGVLTRAIEAISENAPFTSSNCETVTAGGLNSLNDYLYYHQSQEFVTGDISVGGFIDVSMNRLYTSGYEVVSISYYITSSSWVMIIPYPASQTEIKVRLRNMYKNPVSGNGFMHAIYKKVN